MTMGDKIKGAVDKVTDKAEQAKDKVDAKVAEHRAEAEVERQEQRDALEADLKQRAADEKDAWGDQHVVGREDAPPPPE